MENNQIMVMPERGALTAPEIRQQVNLIQEVMRAVMKKDEHYGVVPGTGGKPSLLKPGAEKLAMTFRLAPEVRVEDLSGRDERRYRVTVHLKHITSGNFVGSGVGECSSDEEKYRWKRAFNDQEFQEAPEDRRREKWTKFGKMKQIRTNPADVANTILKMAKKRALVDAVLTATAASDIFTQDIEESVDQEEDFSKPAHGSTTSATPATMAAPTAAKARPVTTEAVPDGETQKKSFVPKSVKPKSKTPKGTYAPGVIESKDGYVFKTYSEKFLEDAKAAMSMGFEIDIEYKESKYGLDIITMDGQKAKAETNDEPPPY